MSDWSNEKNPGADAPARVRWGIPDVLICYIGGILGAVIVASIVNGIQTEPSDQVLLLASLIGQLMGTVSLLVWVSRTKGQRSLKRDFGLKVHLKNWDWLLYGAGLGVLLGIFVLPLRELAGNDSTQGVVEELEKANGLHLWLLAAYAGICAPILEELLFRGLLLRSLARRMKPTLAVLLSALSFGAVHLTDASLGTIVALPGLVTLGIILAIPALKGDLSKSILLHAGFNLLTVVALLS